MSERVKKLFFLFLAGFSLVFYSGAVMAQHEGHGGAPLPSQKKGDSHSMSMKDRPVESMTVYGYMITLDIMDMSMHMKMQSMKGNPMQGMDHSQSHAMMVTVQDTTSKEIISDAKVTYTLIAPSGEKATGKLEWAGDHYGANISPKGKGNCQVHLIIKSGGMEREAKFTYKVS